MILILVFITSFFVVYTSTPPLIKVARLKNLIDEPGEERKLHKRRIPTIGGIIIFAATIFSFAIWFPSEQFEDAADLRHAMSDFKYLVATILILFFVGIKDDIIGTAAIKKLVANIFVALILVLMADIRLTSLHGIFGILEIPFWASVFISLLTYIVIINSFNLIDGVDGLASGIGLIVALAYGFWFLMAGNLSMACLSFSLAGALLSFLIYNFSPARIFMGDSGSLTIGLIIAILTIKLIESDRAQINSILLTEVSKPVYAIAVLIFPLFDTLRIFIYRTARGNSPFEADRNHIHHRLLDLGLSHPGTVMTLYAANIFMILLAVLMKDLDSSISLILLGIVATVLSQIPHWLKQRKLRNTAPPSEKNIAA